MKGLVVRGFARAATRVAMSDVAVREDNNRKSNEAEGENASPDNRRENERRKFFRGADDSVHNVLPQKAVTARLLAPLAISAHNPLRARQFPKSHWSARVKLLGRYSYFGTETELTAVRKPRRCIDHHDRRVNLGYEPFRIRHVVGDDGVRVMG